MILRRGVHRALMLVLTAVMTAVLAAQDQPAEDGWAPLGDGPWTFRSHRVVLVTKGVSYPWSMAFLPTGEILVTERAGQLRIIRNGVLDPKPIAGVPQVTAGRFGRSGLMDVVLHPKFAENKLIYLTYTKPGPEKKLQSATLARGRWDGNALTDVRDLFTASPWDDHGGGAGSRIAFGRDGMIYMTTGAAGGEAEWPTVRKGENGSHKAQDPNDHKGKVLRLREDGTAPTDNPFVGHAGYKPEIYSLGHRNQMGLAIHPETGEVWTNENGPQGGDEINVILPGRNYGWPLVSDGNTYEGPRFKSWQEGMEPPRAIWVPSPGVSGMAFISGDRFPAWKGNVFVGALRGRGIWRIILNKDYQETRRELLLTELKQRIRDVRQSPDGFVYVATDEKEGAILRIEPVAASK